MTTYYYVCIFLGALVVLFPQDAFIFAQLVEYKIKLHYINGRMFLAAWCMYRKLKKDFAAQGWPAPPFRYVHIWDRETK